MLVPLCKIPEIGVLGYTKAAIQHKINTGVWRRGIEYHKAPDGKLFIDEEAIASWVKGESDVREVQRSAARPQGPRQSALLGR